MNGAITEVYLTSGETIAACATRFIRGLRKRPLLRHRRRTRSIIIIMANFCKSGVGDKVPEKSTLIFGHAQIYL